MIDSHCHLDLLASKKDLNTALERAKAAGLTRLMAPSINPHSWQTLQALNSEYQHLLPIDTALGVHPYFLSSNECDLKNGIASLSQEQLVKGQLYELENAAAMRHPSVKAIGETGIDGHIKVPLKLQQQVFNAHLNVAERCSLPVIVHHRKSHHLLLEAFKQARYQGEGVIHAFSGSVEVAKRYIERGFYLGIGGTITYERAKKTRETLGYLLEHHFDNILLETDSPDMPMCGRQGEPNEPYYLNDVVEAISSTFSVAPSEVIATTTANYFRLFGIEQSHV